MSNGDQRIQYVKPTQPEQQYSQFQQAPESPWGQVTEPAPGSASHPRAVSYGALLGQTMLLVGLALVVMTFGAFIGRDYSRGTAMAFSIGGFVMLMGQSFVSALRHGLIGMTWLFGAALAIGLGLGPVLSYYVSVNPDIVMESAAMTAVIVLGAASFGTLTSRDLARWMKPLSLIVFATVLVSWGMLAFGAGGSPIISIVIGLFSAALIIVDFNYLRRRATEDDVIWLATGIFVSIVNIFLSLLNLNSD